MTALENVKLVFDQNRLQLEGSFVAEVYDPEDSRKQVKIICKVNAGKQYENPKNVPNANRTKIFISDAITQNPILDIVSGYRFSRPFDWYKTWVPDVLKEIWKACGYVPSPHKLSWSQHTGCFCRCSPGFLLKDEWGYAELCIFTTIWIDIQVMGEQAEVQPFLESVEAPGL